MRPPGFFVPRAAQSGTALHARASRFRGDETACVVLASPGMTTPIAQVSFQASNGQYVSVASGRLLANANTLGEHERFDVIVLKNHRVALRASNGRYVGIDYRAGRTLVAKAMTISESESFRLEDLGEGNVAIHGYDAFAGAEYGGGRELVVNRQKLGRWETFKQIISLPEAVAAVLAVG